MSSSCIPYATGSFSPEQTRDVHARAWSYAFQCFERHKRNEAAPESRPDDARKDQDAGTYPIVHDQPSLLGDVRQALSLRPAWADFPARLAEHLEADERAVRTCLEALTVEDEVLA